jgi:DNA (cytosine-5)-methyltransferase 1
MGDGSMTHLDLFSGIGGFALAAQTVWGEEYHCVGFCEIDHFCQQVLAKNFQGVKIYGDIRGLTAERLAADATGQGLERREQKSELPERQQSARYSGERLAADTISERERGIMGERNGEKGEVQDGTSRPQKSWPDETGNGYSESRIDLLTGGFPCQPFSTAGKRKGTQDDRFLWPEMFRVIRETKPRWIIGENVAGIITMALDQVVAELESQDYEVQCFIIPAVSVNAPHRRDRVWIVAHSKSEHGERTKPIGDRRWQSEMPTGDRDCSSSNTSDEGLQGSEWARAYGEGQAPHEPTAECHHLWDRQFPDWTRDWREVALESCVRRVDDGVSKRVARLPDGTEISESKWRQEALKAYGNSIVPEVAMEIMRAIKAIDEAAEVNPALQCAA